MIETGLASRDGAEAASSVLASMSLDNLNPLDVRFLQEAARLGKVHVELWSDALVRFKTGRPAFYPQDERLFLARALRYVARARVVRRDPTAAVREAGARPAALAVRPAEDDHDVRARCLDLGIDYHVIGDSELVGFPPSDVDPSAIPSGKKRAVVTGCFDVLHSGHVQFFLDAARLGELYVIVGSDENVGLLKGQCHPMRRQDERRYMVGAVRSVHRALISTGSGWMDAEPEIDAIAPHAYVVNEDGDRPEKRAFCQAHGLDYVVLHRTPHAGLPSRTSTELRGY